MPQESGEKRKDLKRAASDRARDVKTARYAGAILQQYTSNAIIGRRCKDINIIAVKDDLLMIKDWQVIKS